MPPNGIERSIGRLEGKMDNVIDSLKSQNVKLDSVEDGLSKIKGGCPIFTGKKLTFGEIPGEKKSLIQKAKENPWYATVIMGLINVITIFAVFVTK